MNPYLNPDVVCDSGVACDHDFVLGSDEFRQYMLANYPSRDCVKKSGNFAHLLGVENDASSIMDASVGSGYF